MNIRFHAGLSAALLLFTSAAFAAEPGEAAGEEAGAVAMGSTEAVGIGAVAALAGIALAASSGSGSQTGTTTTTTTNTR